MASFARRTITASRYLELHFPRAAQQISIEVTFPGYIDLLEFSNKVTLPSGNSGPTEALSAGSTIYRLRQLNIYISHGQVSEGNPRGNYVSYVTTTGDATGNERWVRIDDLDIQPTFSNPQRALDGGVANLVIHEVVPNGILPECVQVFKKENKPSAYTADDCTRDRTRDRTRGHARSNPPAGRWAGHIHVFKKGHKLPPAFPLTKVCMVSV